MAKETESCCGEKNWNKGAACGGAGAVYGFGLIGALFYYLGGAGSFSAVMLGIGKSLVWPAMMVYHLFKFLNM